MTAILAPVEQRREAAEALSLTLLKNATTLSKRAAASATTPEAALSYTQAALSLINTYVALWADQ